MEEKQKYLIEYYTKGIHVDEEREVIGAILHDFNDNHKRIIRVAKEDWTKLVKVGLFDTLEDVNGYLQKIKNLFIAVNERMIKNERYPLFKNVDDLEACMAWRDKLATFMPESECNKIVGCKSYKEHYPLIYKNK